MKKTLEPPMILSREDELLQLINEQAKDMAHGPFQPPQDKVVFSLDQVQYAMRHGGTQTYAEGLSYDEYGQVQFA